MNDSEIFYMNVRNECDRQHKTLYVIENMAGNRKSTLAQSAAENRKLSVRRIRAYAKVLGVPMLKLMEGMLDG